MHVKDEATLCYSKLRAEETDIVILSKGKEDEVKSNTHESVQSLRLKEILSVITSNYSIC